MERVCPFCGEPPGAGVFCAACGRNLANVERLPTRVEWERAEGAGDPAAATAEFLAAMAAAGNPGAERLARAGGGLRRRFVEGWVIRPVDREDFDGPKRYEPGLVLTVDGAWHRLDSELRGWGQRDFPHTCTACPRSRSTRRPTRGWSPSSPPCARPTGSGGDLPTNFVTG